MNTLVEKALPLTLLLALAGNTQAADSPAGAQSAPAPASRMSPRHMDPATMTRRMTTNLGLSPEQVTEVEQINQRFATQFEQQRKQQEAMRAAHQEAMGKIAAERDAALKKVLSEEQYGRHVAHRQEMQERRRAHRGPGGPGTGPRAAEAPAPTPPTQ